MAMIFRPIFVMPEASRLSIPVSRLAAESSAPLIPVATSPKAPELMPWENALTPVIDSAS